MPGTLIEVRHTPFEEDSRPREPLPQPSPSAAGAGRGGLLIGGGLFDQGGDHSGDGTPPVDFTDPEGRRWANRFTGIWLRQPLPVYSEAEFVERLDWLRSGRFPSERAPLEHSLTHTTLTLPSRQFLADVYDHATAGGRPAVDYVPFDALSMDIEQGELGPFEWYPDQTKRREVESHLLGHINQMALGMVTNPRGFGAKILFNTHDTIRGAMYRRYNR